MQQKNKQGKPSSVRSGKKVFGILRIVGIGVLAVILALELFVLGLRLFGGEKAVADLPVYILEITSDSMYPRLKTGDCVICADVPFEQLKVGDMISFSNTGELVTHEIIRVNDNGTVTTKGSRNTYDDGEISESYYVGKVVANPPFLSVFLGITSTWGGKIMMIALILVLCYGYPAGMAMAEKLSQKEK